MYGNCYQCSGRCSKWSKSQKYSWSLSCFLSWFKKFERKIELGDWRDKKVYKLEFWKSEEADGEGRWIFVDLLAKWPYKWFDRLKIPLFLYFVSNSHNLIFFLWYQFILLIQTFFSPYLIEPKENSAVNLLFYNSYSIWRVFPHD